MVFDRKTRRMFLRTAGTSLLAAPFLPSLLPRGAYAQAASPRRYVQFLSQWGIWQRSDLVPAIASQSPARPPGVDDCLYLETKTPRAQALLGAQPIASQFGADLLPYLNFVRGLNVFKASHQHNASLATTASFPSPNNTNVPAEIASHPFPSIDWIAEQKLYDASWKGPRAARALLGMNYNNRWYGSWSWGWDAATSKTYRIEPATTMDALWGATFGKFSGGPAPADPTAALQKKSADLALEDYTRVAGHRRISAADKQRLEQFMDLMNAAEAPGLVLPGACTKPAAPADDPNWGIKYRRAIDLLVAALACDITRVVSVQVMQTSDNHAYDYNLVHPWSHGQGTDPGGNLRTVVKWRTGLATYLLRRLLEVKDALGRPLLDSTVFYLGNEFGPVSAQNGENMNEGNDIPVVVGGGGNGRLRTGLILDYVMRPYNNLLATLAYALGLTSADFEVRGQPGFGMYRRAVRSGAIYAFAAATYDKYNDTAKRREALPMMLK